MKTNKPSAALIGPWRRHHYATFKPLPADLQQIKDRLIATPKDTK